MHFPSRFTYTYMGVKKETMHFIVFYYELTFCKRVYMHCFEVLQFIFAFLRLYIRNIFKLSQKLDQDLYFWHNTL